MEEKKKKYIGRTTFGISLILFGITLAIQTISTIDVLRYVLMLWPLIIISLGIEIIYFSKRNDIDTKYDFLGIIITGLVVFIGIGFSILNYGINKILYSNEIKEYLSKEQEFNTVRYFDSNLEIINLDDMPINIKIVESENLDEEVTVNIFYTIKQSENTNLLDLINGENTFFAQYLNIYNLDKDTAILEIQRLPSIYQSIDLVVTTSSKDNIKTNGAFNNL